MVLSAMVPLIDRRRLLSLTATGLVLPHFTAARAQFATHPRTQPSPDELTPPAPVSITVKLSAPQPDFLMSLTDPTMSIIPADFCGKTADQFRAAPIGRHGSVRCWR